MTTEKYLKKNETAHVMAEISRCVTCQEFLPNPPRPVLQASASANILLVGQAPGSKAHASNLPWNDASGDRLRTWLGIDRDTFYDPAYLSLVPMAFCYPGRGKSGDLPPRPECAPQWHDRLITSMPVAVTFLIGQYAQAYYLKDKRTLTDRVLHWQDYQPRYFVLPHPSPRNNIWLKRHPWFEREVVPAMRKRVAALLPDRVSANQSLR